MKIERGGNYDVGDTRELRYFDLDEDNYEESEAVPVA
jgi:hypothetical protein